MSDLGHHKRLWNPVWITKDFLMTMKTCKSGNSTKMFCPQIENFYQNTENLIHLYINTLNG